MRGKAMRVVTSSTQRYRNIAASRMEIARVAFRCSEAEVNEGTFLIGSKEGNQHAEGDTRKNSHQIRTRGENVLAVRCFELQVEEEEREDIHRKKNQRGPIGGSSLPVEQANELFPGTAEGWNAEEDPREANKVEDENTAGPTTQEKWRGWEVGG